MIKLVAFYHHLLFMYINLYLIDDILLEVVGEGIDGAFIKKRNC